MKTEYLMPIEKEGSLITTVEAFSHCLMADKDIKIQDGYILFESDKFKFDLTKIVADEGKVDFYHLTISTEKTNDVESKIVQNYIALLKKIKRILLKYVDNIEVLWDDVSFSCSMEAYPLVYKTENILRQIFTKFMLINVGIDWENNNSNLGISVRQEGKKSKIGNSYLYKIDFIDLSTFLFNPYSKKNELTLKDIESLENNEKILLTDLEDYVKKSNWERYFKKFTSIEKDRFKKNIKDLYDLRNKVAHNRLMTIDDLKQVKILTSTINKELEDIIDHMDKISINLNEKEFISENVAKTRYSSSGEFMLTYNTLLRELEQLQTGVINNKYSSNELLRSSYKNKYLLKEELTKLNEIKNFRNKLVHTFEEDFTDYEILEQLENLKIIRNNLTERLNEESPELKITQYPVVKCNSCSEEFMIEDFELEEFEESCSERSMGPEILYQLSKDIKCPECNHELDIEVMISEYPSMSVDLVETTINHGKLVTELEVAFY